MRCNIHPGNTAVYYVSGIDNVIALVCLTCMELALDKGWKPAQFHRIPYRDG